MVQIAPWLAAVPLFVAGLAAADTAKCKKHAVVEFAQFDHTRCTSDHERPLLRAREGKCHNLEDFLSYKVFPYKLSKHSISGRECEMQVFSDRDCVGRTALPYNVDEQTGACSNTVFADRLSSAPSQGRSIRLVCAKPVKAPKSKAAKPTVHTSQIIWTDSPGKLTTRSVKVPVVPTTTSTVSHFAHTAIATALHTVTLTVTNSASSSSSSSSSTIPSVVTVKSTTSIVVPPVYTTTGISTIWVPAGTTRTPSVAVYTVTYPRAERDIEPRATGMARREAEVEAAEAAEEAEEAEEICMAEE